MSGPNREQGVGEAMDRAEVLVVLGGVLAIGWVIWYFFLGERGQTRAAAGEGGVQRVKIVVRGGYDPARVVVQRGRPVRLEFFRDETSSCSETVVLGDFGISRRLPAHQTTAVEFTPQKPGEFTFTCGMNMMRGQIIVEDGKHEQRGEE